MSAPARSSAFSAATASAARPRLKAIMGDVPPHGSIVFKGKRHRRPQAYEIARPGIGYVPEDRAIFPTLTVEQNLLLGVKAGKKATRWGIGDMLSACSRVSRSARDDAGRRAVRRRAADAHDLPHADGRSRPHHGRRADRGAGAADGRAHRRPAAEHRRARHLHPAGGAEADHRACASRTASM